MYNKYEFNVFLTAEEKTHYLESKVLINHNFLTVMTGGNSTATQNMLQWIY